MALYSPFVERNVDKIAGAQQQAAQTKLAQSAYMGDSEAMGQLYGTNPQLAEKIKQGKLQEQQNRLAMQAKQRKADQEKQKIARQIAEDSARMDYEQAADYAEQQARAYGVDLPRMSREQHEQFKKAFSKTGDSENERKFARNFSVLQEEGAVDEDGNLKPEEELSARAKMAAADAGLIGRAVSSSDITIARDEGLSEQVAESESRIAGAKAGASEEAKLTQQLTFKPQIEEAVTLARAEAAAKGEAITDLQEARAALPGLQDAVSQLRELAPLVTSTIGGKIFDEAVKQTGFGATKGSTARAKFNAIINNQVLPLLKPTFGAAFTVPEGEALKATMGDPDAPPEEKMAQLDAFIDQKMRDLETKERQIAGRPAASDDGWSVEEVQ